MKLDINNKIFALLIIFTMLFLLIISFRNNQQKFNTFFIKPERNVYLGAWTEGFWNISTKSLDPNKLKQFESKIGKKMAIAHYYRGWDDLGSNEFVNQLNVINANGWIPMISANPYHSPGCSSEQPEENIYRRIESGQCDEVINQMANSFNKYGKNVFFRFAWEMNIDTIEWGIQSTQSSPEEYVAAWRHIHNYFNKKKVKNVKWIFAVNVEKDNSIPIDKLYPGDAYVDWVGIDGYNWGNTQSWSTWTDFDKIFYPTYKKMTALTKKPLMISEVGTAQGDGNRIEWFNDFLNVQIPNKYIGVDAIVFFNENKFASEGVDWTITNDDKLQNSININLKNNIYKSVFKKGE